MDVSTSESVSLNSLFCKIQLNLKNSSPLWDDLLSKSNKLHHAIKTVLMCSSLFWESFQKIADTATETQGATKEIGTSFTRLCMRQRLIETKLKNLNQHLLSSLANPVQEKMEEWKRLANQLDKERTKDTKKAKTEWKKASGESIRLQKKALKRGSMRGLGSLQNEVEGALKDQADKFASLQYVESLSLRRVMTHERQRFCFLFSCMKPVLDCEISLVEDMASLNELVKSLSLSTASPDRLPVESEQVIQQIMDPDLEMTSTAAGNMSAAAVAAAAAAAAAAANCDLSTHFSSGFGGSSSRKSSVASLNSHHSSSLASSSGGAPSIAPRNGSGEAQPNAGETAPTTDTTTGLGASHLSMNSSGQEASGYSGDYRVSDDDIRQSKPPGHSKKREDDDDDEDDDDEEDDEEEDEEDDEEAKTPSSPTVSLWSEKLTQHADTGQMFRHTISGVREHARQPITPSLFDPPTKTQNQSNTSLTKVDQSRQLYPNQAIPLPVYTNLRELTNAAQRKYSMNTGSVYGSGVSEMESHPTIVAAANSGVTNNNISGNSNSSIIYSSVSPAGSKTPSIRRMTLPEVPLIDKERYAVPMRDNNLDNSQYINGLLVTDIDDVTPTPSPRNSLFLPENGDSLTSLDCITVSNIIYAKLPHIQITNNHQNSSSMSQTSTLTRQQSEHYQAQQQQQQNYRCSQPVKIHQRSTSVSEHGHFEESQPGSCYDTAQIAQTGASQQQSILKPGYGQHSSLMHELAQQMTSRQQSDWADIDPELPMPPPPNPADADPPAVPQLPPTLQYHPFSPNH